MQDNRGNLNAYLAYLMLNTWLYCWVIGEGSVLRLVSKAIANCPQGTLLGNSKVNTRLA